MPKDRWRELLSRVSEDDQLPTRIVGAWSEKKLFFWNRYIDITTRAMVAWRAGLIYVDLFAGPGVCTLKETRTRIPGSPLLAAMAPRPFRKILPCEMDPKNAHACQTRLAAVGAGDRSLVFTGDCNQSVVDMIPHIPRGALTLAFIDPTGLHADFETIAQLARCGRVDLLILFADGQDIVRNVKLYYEQGKGSNLDRMLGPDLDWRSELDKLDTWTSYNIRELFASLYRSQLRKHLGYRASGSETISAGKKVLYRLIYASKHERGLEFWNKITKKDPSGQTGFDWVD